MSLLRMIYLGLAFMGAVVPIWPLINWMVQTGQGLFALLAHWKTAHDGDFLTYALTWDLMIAGLALTVWMVAETSVRRNWSALWAIPATFLMGVSCGLPLYLFLRTRPV